MTQRPTPPEPDDDLPPIPTGGLGEAFPDWLRERPAWAMPSVVIDDSPIDPRELVGLDDLPAWLQAIATDRERRLEGLTLPDLGDRPSATMADGGVDAATVVIDAMATPMDTSSPPVGDASPAVDDDAHVPAVAPANAQAVGTTPEAEPAPDLDVETPALPFPNYVRPPQVSPRGRDVTTSLRNDPVLVALVVAAVAIVFGTVVLLIVQ